MAQQSINFLMKLNKKKNHDDLRKNGNSGPFEYIPNMPDILEKKCAAQDVSFFLDLNGIDEALQVNLSAKVTEIYSQKAAYKGKFKILQNFISAQEIVDASLAHTRYTSFYLFRAGVEKSQIKD